MSIRIATYNIEWFNREFNADNSLKLTGQSKKKLTAIKQVLELLGTDLATIGVHP